MNSTEASASPPQQPPKHTRRKLQKCDPKLKNLKTKRGSTDSSASSALSPSPRQISNGAPDLSDSKWSHYLRPQSIVSPSSPELSPQPSPRLLKPSLPQIIPEFSHLNIQDQGHRPSLDYSSLPSPVSSTSTSSTMRRQAKTPVFRIGQLERKQQQQQQQQPHRFSREPELAEKTSSVDLIADQYRALLESRDGLKTDSVYEGSVAHSDAWQDILNVPVSAMMHGGQSRSRASSRAGDRPEPLRKLTPPSQPSANSEETMIGFEEDVIYFKPISFSTEPSPQPSPRFPRQDFNNTPPASRPQSTDNLSLQICLELLTRELSSAMTERPQSRGGDKASLQIWVMIEAYERLRDQVTKMADFNPELAHVGQIFDTWLSALYAIHGSMAGHGAPKESEYAGLQEDVD